MFCQFFSRAPRNGPCQKPSKELIMSSVSKALDLLSLFSQTRPEIGLSQLCRLAGRDKATTYRHLQALESAFFVEQNPVTKAYRLGPALLQLATLRELTVPRKSSAEAAIARLAAQTGETAHVTVLSGDRMHALADCESAEHSIRVNVDLTVFPLHATASGIAALAFGPDELWPIALSDLTPFSADTPTTEAALIDLIGLARRTGIAWSKRAYQLDTESLSAPIYGHGGVFAGAVSVACVAARFDAALEARVIPALIEASRSITQSWGGIIPPALETAWAAQLSRIAEPETAA